MTWVAIIIGLALAAGLLAWTVRRRPAGRPHGNATPVGRGADHVSTLSSEASSAAHLERLNRAVEANTSEGGTTKIDRSALRSIIGPESSVAEEAYFLVIAGESMGRLIKLDRERTIIGRDEGTADIVFRDSTISKEHAEVRLIDGQVHIRDLGSSNGTYVDGREVESATLTDGARVVLGKATVLTLTFQDELGERFQARMYESATRDALTGALKKATFLDQVTTEMHYAKRHGTNFLVVIMDIDHFKNINDEYGHVVGDEVLAEIGKLVKSVTREEAMFVRYGGEEFILAERNADRAMGKIVAERIRSAVESAVFDTSAGPLKITMSLGVADVRSAGEADLIRVINSADQALYQSKRAGRNRVTVAE